MAAILSKGAEISNPILRLRQRSCHAEFALVSFLPAWQAIAGRRRGVLSLLVKFISSKGW
jgi:hypothetical protein